MIIVEGAERSGSRRLRFSSGFNFQTLAPGAVRVSVAHEFSCDVAIIGSVSNELWCAVEAQQDLATSAPFRNLASSSESCASEQLLADFAPAGVREAGGLGGLRRWG